MKRILLVMAGVTALAGASAGAAYADSDRGHGRYDERHDGKHYDRDRGHHRHHSEWRKGYRMAQTDWRRGHRIDYRHYRLSAPPRGYEWREVDGDYVLAAVATGLIMSVILNN